MPDVLTAASLGFAIAFGIVPAGLLLLVLRLLHWGSWRTDLLIAFALFAACFAIGWMRIRRAQAGVLAPRNALHLEVVARGGHWWFRHPGQGEPTPDAVWVPVDVSVQLRIQNETDAGVSFDVPSMRCQRDVVPGGRGEVWFTAVECGDYHVFAAALDGTGAPDPQRPVQAMLHVVDRDTWEQQPWR